MKRYDNSFPSVTEILGYIRKPGLEHWFKNNSLDFCEKTSRRSIVIGNHIHKAIEAAINKTDQIIDVENVDEVRNALAAFNNFRENVVDNFTFSEMKLSSKIINLNGTIDCLKKTNDGIILIDWKTGECKGKDMPPIYPEYLLQVSAYWHIYKSNFFDERLQKAIIAVFSKDKEGIYNHIVLKPSDVETIYCECFLPLYNFVMAYKKMKGD